GDRGGKSTFDVRATKAGEQLKKTAGIDLGKAPDKKKTSFVAALNAQKEKAKEEAKALKPSDERAKEVKEMAEKKLASQEFKESEAKAKEAYFASAEGKEKIKVLEDVTAHEEAKKELKIVEDKKVALVKDKTEAGEKVKNFETEKKNLQTQRAATKDIGKVAEIDANIAKVDAALKTAQTEYTAKS